MRTQTLLRNGVALPPGLVCVRAETNPEIILREMASNVEAFKQRHNDRLLAVENAIDDLAKASAAARMGGGGSTSNAERKEFYTSLGQYVRTGKDDLLPKAAMSSDNDPAGGYLDAPVMSDTIRQKVWDVSPIARLARRVSITTGSVFEEPWDMSDIGADWVGEREERPTKTGPNINMMSYPVHEIYTNQPVTQRLLDDTRFDLGGWLEGKIAAKFGRSEGNAYVNGNGVNKPRGILQYTTAATGDATREFGKVQYIPTGDNSGFVAASSSVSPADALFNVVYSLRAPYRPNARWLMNLATASVIRKFKDPEGRYVWADAREGMPAMLCGFPVEFDEEMPNIGGNAFPVAFGDFQQGYLIVEKPGIRLLRDPYTSRPHVLFYAYRRVGGGLQNSEAIKLLKVASS